MTPCKRGRSLRRYTNAAEGHRRRSSPILLCLASSTRNAIRIIILLTTVTILLEAFRLLKNVPRHRHYTKQPQGPSNIHPPFADIVRWIRRNKPQAEETNSMNKSRGWTHAVMDSGALEPDRTVDSSYQTLINGRVTVSRKASSRLRKDPSTALVPNLAWIAKNVPFPLDDFRDRYTNGHRVRRLCRLGRINTLLFIHTDPNHVAERRFYRSTIGHASLESLYRWTLVFFVGTRPTVNLTVEGYHNGDVVQLPFVDSYRNLTYKFVYGMRWVLLNCPKVRAIVKLDDDVFVHVPALHTYLQRYVNVEESSIHCSVVQDDLVVRNPKNRLHLSEKEYPRKSFPRHCRGWAAIFPVCVMLPLYAAAFHTPFYARDDAYVTGDVALKAGVGHRDISAVMSDTEGRFLETVEGRYIFALFSGKRKLKLREILWKTMVQMQHEREVETALDRTLV